MATEPEAFKQLVGLCREMQQALGQKERVLTEADFKQREKMRRSVIATRDLKAGTVLVRDDLDVNAYAWAIDETVRRGLFEWKGGVLQVADTYGAWNAFDPF